MENNNYFIELKSNSKQAYVKIDLINLLVDEQFFFITILMMEIKYKEHIYKKDFVNQFLLGIFLIF